MRNQSNAALSARHARFTVIANDDFTRYHHLLMGGLRIRFRVEGATL